MIVAFKLHLDYIPNGQFKKVQMASLSAWHIYL